MKQKEKLGIVPVVKGRERAVIPVKISVASPNYNSVFENMNKGNNLRGEYVGAGEIAKMNLELMERGRTASPASIYQTLNKTLEKLV